MTYKIKTINNREVEVTPKVQLYSVKDFMGKDLHGLAVNLDWINPDTNMLEPFGMLTVTFGEYISAKNCSYVDTNNCPFAEQFLEYGIAYNTGLTKDKGFCKYPLWVFNEEFLKEHGAENYKYYLDERAKYLKESLGYDGEDGNPEETEEPEPEMKM